MRQSLPSRIAALTSTLMLLAAGSASPRGAIAQDAPPDKYTRLEDIHSAKAMAWVEAENARTAAVLEKDPHFAPLEADALKLLDSPDRIPYPEFRGGVVYNGWQDANHIRGIVRRTSLKDYLSSNTTWQTVIDYDALSKQDNQSWVGKELVCLQPQLELCLVSLSAGGEDAVTLREFDLKTGNFIKNGFVLPRGKQRTNWLDKDTLLIARDWGPGTMAEDGYPITLREWRRGTPLDSAKEIFRGTTKDTSVSPVVLLDGSGNRAALVERDVTFFESEYYLLLPGGPKKLAMPLKVSIGGLVHNQLIVSLSEDWDVDSRTLKQGSVVALDLAIAQKDPAHLHPSILFTPTTQEFAQQAATTKNHVLLTTLANVQGRAYVYTLGSNQQWTRTQLPVPDNQSISILSTTSLDDRFFLSQAGFLTPDAALLGDAATGTLTLAKAGKPLFDSANEVVEQFEAVSKDQTRVPYFIVHRKDMPLDGNNPTLLTAYGGFELSSTPYYDAVLGKLWLEHGGVFVLANIRGGAEFGPAWHYAGIKTHRQRIYDDFYAVAQNLIARKVTSVPRLGIQGGSNGGLLMGVAFTQHPEMWTAVVMQVPLLDMLGYEHLSAGASWVGEFGSVSVPEERAFLASISPYNQLRPGVHYPVPLIFTTTKDDRVGPVHARKFAARMEEFHLPFYYDEIGEGGHGPGADNKQEARTDAELYTYLMMKLMN